MPGRFSRGKLITLICCLLFFTAALLTFLLRPRSRPGGLAAPGLAQRLHRLNPLADRSDRNLQGDPVRSRKLRELKDKWMALRPRYRTNERTALDEGGKLAKECAAELLTSAEMIQLLNFLHENDLYGATVSINYALADMLRNPSAEAAACRQLIPGLAHRPPGTSGPSDPFPDWLYASGQGCTADDFSTFVAALDDQDAPTRTILTTQLGYNTRLAATDPQQALRSTLDIFTAPDADRPGYCQPAVYDQVAHLPAGFDYTAVADLFPQPGDDVHANEVLSAMRSTFFGRWAQADPASAANYVLEHPDTSTPADIVTIAAQVSNKDPHAGFTWAETFPPGPLQEAAAYSAIMQWGPYYRDEATKTLGLITNPDKRAEAEKRIRQDTNFSDGH